MLAMAAPVRKTFTTDVGQNAAAEASYDRARSLAL